MCKCKFNQFKQHQGKRCKWRHRHRVDGGGSGDQWRILADSRELSALPGRRSTENMDEATTKWFRLTITFTPPSLPRGRPSENGWGKKKKPTACCERHCIIYTEEHKQSWTNCLKRKMWSLCIHRSIRLHTRAHSRTARSLPAAWKTSLLLVPVNVSAILILHSYLKTLSSFQTGRVRWWEDHQLCAETPIFCCYWFGDLTKKKKGLMVVLG